ncbi:ATP-NAD kinase-like domain-containing protein [Scheffersomyces xylosifermentans]|uniref:ATP-NAD kinase-like domain-containing protein n=1 Tax=Scheffersomyces xylosifermentans TaxID=1304137 RepID=UPI00315CDC13
MTSTIEPLFFFESNYLTDTKVYVLDSVNSGTGRTEKKDLYHQILKPIFELINVDHEYIATTSASTVSEFAKSLDGSRDSTVIFISGDTSVNEFVNNLSDKPSAKLKLFTFPSGTGNSLALSVGLTDEIDALKKLFNSSSKVAPLNLYEVDFPKGSYFLVQDEKTTEIEGPLKFLVVLSWGFHASLVADSDTPELRKHGIERFKLAAFSNLEQEQKYEGHVKAGDELLDGPFAYWLLTSAKRFEPTFEISPKGDILEESLYLVSFKTEESPSYIMDIMMQIYNKGSHIDNKNVTYKKLTKDDKIVLTTTNSKSLRKRRFCLDGSIIALPEADEHQLSFNIAEHPNRQFNWELFIVF